MKFEVSMVDGVDFFKVFVEQKKMFKTGLNIARFRQHIPMIVEETETYFERWGSSGERGKLDFIQLTIKVHILQPSMIQNIFYPN